MLIFPALCPLRGNAIGYKQGHEDEGEDIDKVVDDKPRETGHNGHVPAHQPEDTNIDPPGAGKSQEPGKDPKNECRRERCHAGIVP